LRRGARRRIGHGRFSASTIERPAGPQARGKASSRHPLGLRHRLQHADADNLTISVPTLVHRSGRDRRSVGAYAAARSYRLALPAAARDLVVCIGVLQAVASPERILDEPCACCGPAAFSSSSAERPCLAARATSAHAALRRLPRGCERTIHATSMAGSWAVVSRSWPAWRSCCRHEARPAPARVRSLEGERQLESGC